MLGNKKIRQKSDRHHNVEDLMEGFRRGPVRPDSRKISRIPFAAPLFYPAHLRLQIVEYSKSYRDPGKDWNESAWNVQERIHDLMNISPAQYYDRGYNDLRQAHDHEDHFQCEPIRRIEQWADELALVKIPIAHGHLQRMPLRLEDRALLLLKHRPPKLSFLLLCLRVDVIGKFFQDVCLVGGRQECPHALQIAI